MKKYFFPLLFILTLMPFRILAQNASTEKIAIFAAGCFWCIQPPFDALLGKGVSKVTVGYSGGDKTKTTYEEVSSGTSGHREVIEVRYDPSKISYKDLLSIFWKNIDPLNEKGQFCDTGFQYSSAIYTADAEQKKLAEESKIVFEKMLKIKGKIVTSIVEAKEFFAAEDYHQSFYTKNPIRYKYYRFSCGRDKRLETLWGSESEPLTP